MPGKRLIFYDLNNDEDNSRSEEAGEGGGLQKGSRGRLGGECFNDSVDRDDDDVEAGNDVDVSVVVVVVHLKSHIVNV